MSLLVWEQFRGQNPQVIFWSRGISGLSGESGGCCPLNPDLQPLIFATSSVHLILSGMVLDCLPTHENLCLPIVYSGVP